ncbi:MAG: M20/M25/M40 family metallo-hydrolase [Bacteroidetes bacterium]|nr:MAG: M20/M25/M40 family metallo-hydrolase [Bacteroidota bacterium]
MITKQAAIVVLCMLAPALTWAGPERKEKANADVMAKIKEEGSLRSKVMEFAFRLTDVSGPRLAVSPGYLNAANWAKQQLVTIGLSNARLEAWGQFGKGWQQEKCYVAMRTPYYTPIIAIPKAWTGSTPGKREYKSEVVLVKATDSTSFASQYVGKLKGKIVMQLQRDTLRPSFTPDGRRYHDSTLTKMANAEPVQRQNPDFPIGPDMAQRFQRMNQMRRVSDLINKEKPALILSYGSRGTDGTIFVSGGGGYAPGSPMAPANVVISSDEYMRMQRLLEANIPVTVEAQVRTSFFTDDMNGYNVLAEIPGTDPLLKDEVVMLGAHLDSWQGSTGATDNAAGTSVMMEAMRILKAIGIEPRRTIRIALWNAEEQGLYGSRGWVKNNLADPADMVLKNEHSKLAAYFNLDNGTGRIRGIYTQSNLLVKPIFQAWLDAFGHPDAKTVTISNTGGTDHQSFDAVGIPGFQFIQDEIEYDTRTHHTNMDSYDHLVPEDLKQAAQIVAHFVYMAAMRDEMLPRKTLPKPRAARQ